MDDFAATVRAWIAADPDPATRQELEVLLASGGTDELARRFSAPLRFGTAGLRGRVEAGPGGMNRLTVRRATQGVAGWLHAMGSDMVARGVVVGRDARRGSEDFNDEVVAVLLGAGIPVFEMPRPLPTPLVAFAVRGLQAAAGIMITASHNPPDDNGYKLYDHDGAQIIPPHDEIVEAGMRDAGEPVLGERGSDLHQHLGQDIVDAYVAHMAANHGLASPSPLRIAYTPLHGVGGETATALLTRSGFRHVEITPTQFTPDPAFPTLPFPNPEEPGALDLVMAVATAANADLVIANDPDADRLGAAIPTKDGQWRPLRGDEIGWLLGAATLRRGVAAGDVIATTIVSSSMLSRMATAAGVPFSETLTGFKWISRAGWSVGASLAFGYEEALGYAVDPAVADKDGMSAAVVLARLAHELALEGRTLSDLLDDLACEHGVHAVDALTVRYSGADYEAVIAETLSRLRSAPPETLGGLDVSDVVDLAKGLHGLPPTEGLLMRLGDRGRVVVRPSGTEPKLKSYLEVRSAPLQRVDLDARRSDTARLLAAVKDDLSRVLEST